MKVPKAVSKLSALIFCSLAFRYSYDALSESSSELGQPSISSGSNFWMKAALCLRRTNEYYLTFELKYLGTNTITVFPENLPWENPNSLFTAAFDARRGEEGLFNRLFEIVDHIGAPRVVIRPGQILTGEVSLKKIYPNLVGAINKSDVMIFWSWHTPEAESSRTEWLGGMVIAPKRE